MDIHTHDAVSETTTIQCRRGSVSPGEEPPPHSGELNHVLSQVGGPAQSQLSRPMSSGHHISMEHRLRRKHVQLNSDTDASNETFWKEIQEKRKRRNMFRRKNKNEKKKEQHGIEVTHKWATFDPLSTKARKSKFHQRKSSFSQWELRRFFVDFEESGKTKEKKRMDKTKN